jgi:hypothetical protein
MKKNKGKILNKFGTVEIRLRAAFGDQAQQRLCSWNLIAENWTDSAFHLPRR